MAGEKRFFMGIGDAPHTGRPRIYFFPRPKKGTDVPFQGQTRNRRLGTDENKDANNELLSAPSEGERPAVPRRIKPAKHDSGRPVR